MMRVTASANLRTTTIHKAFFSRLYSQAAKANQLFQANLKDEKMIMDLIFGPRKYQELSLKEKALVDKYQEKIYQESCGCVVLPNTFMDLEEREVCELSFKKRT